MRCDLFTHWRAGGAPLPQRGKERLLFMCSATWFTSALHVLPIYSVANYIHFQEAAAEMSLYATEPI
jgi:hypothetical protein